MGKAKRPKSLKRIVTVGGSIFGKAYHKLSNKEGIKGDITKTGIESCRDGLPGTNILRYFVCNRSGRCAMDCCLKPDRKQSGYSRLCGRTGTCYQCTKIEYERRHCQNSRRSLLVLWVGGGPVELTSQSYQVECAVQVGREFYEFKVGNDVKVENYDYLELNRKKN